MNNYCLPLFAAQTFRERHEYACAWPCTPPPGGQKWRRMEIGTGVGGGGGTPFRGGLFGLYNIVSEDRKERIIEEI